MVGTTRFELATSPTPRVRSTRLSHVPTFLCMRPAAANRAGHTLGSCWFLVYTRAVLPLRGDLGPRGLHCLHSASVRRWNILLGQFAAFAFAEEESVHLLHKKLLRLARPRLQTIFIQQHLLPLHPLVPRLLRHVLIDLLSEV